MPYKDINIYGFNPVKEAIENDHPLRAVFIRRGKKSPQAKEIIRLCKEKNIPVIFKEKFYFKTERRNYWIFAQTSFIKTLRDDFIEEEKIEEPIVFLYKIQDPQNLGSILRTSSAFGINYVALTLEESAPINEIVSRTSEGALNFLKLALIKKPLAFLKKAKEIGFKIFSGTMEGIPVKKVDFQKKSILILGSEGKGIPREIKEISDFLISIPLKGSIKSLNVSTAGGILIYELQNKL